MAFDLSGQLFRLNNLMGPEVYDRSGDSLVTPGLYLDLPAWGYSVYQLVVTE